MTDADLKLKSHDELLRQGYRIVPYFTAGMMPTAIQAGDLIFSDSARSYVKAIHSEIGLPVDMFTSVLRKEEP